VPAADAAAAAAATSSSPSSAIAANNHAVVGATSTSAAAAAAVAQTSGAVPFDESGCSGVSPLSFAPLESFFFFPAELTKTLRPRPFAAGHSHRHRRRHSPDRHRDSQRRFRSCHSRFDRFAERRSVGCRWWFCSFFVLCCWRCCRANRRCDSCSFCRLRCCSRCRR
jgi:hypothetical protein